MAHQYPMMNHNGTNMKKIPHCLADSLCCATEINTPLYINHGGGGLVAWSRLTPEAPWTVVHQAPLWDFPGKNTAARGHLLFQHQICFN